MPLNNTQAVGSAQQATALSFSTNNQQASGGSRGIQAPQPSPGVLAATPAGSTSGQGGAQSRRALHVLMSDLSISPIEPAHQMLSIPGVRRMPPPGANLPYHPATSELHGLNYFNALGDESGLPLELRVLCKSHKLGRSNGLSPELIQQYENKLRYVAHRLRVGGDELKTKVNICASEALTSCVDRTGYFLEQMFLTAYLDELSSSTHRVDEHIYNTGLGFYTLERLRFLVADLLSGNPRSKAMREHAPDLVGRTYTNRESVETMLHVEYMLQDRLNLPVKHHTPSYSYVSELSAEDLDTLVRVLQVDLMESDGERFWDFMGEWEPWVNHLQTQPSVQAELDVLNTAYSERLELLESLGAPEIVIKDESDAALNAFREWKQTLFGQKAREFCMTYRVDYFKARNGHFPAVFDRR